MQCGLREIETVHLFSSVLGIALNYEYLSEFWKGGERVYFDVDPNQTSPLYPLV